MVSGMLTELPEMKAVVINDFNHTTSLLESPQFSIGSIAVNPKANKIVYAYRFLRQFDIINSYGEIEKTISVSPGSSSSLFAKHIDKRNLNMCYIGAKTYKDSFYLLFEG